MNQFQILSILLIGIHFSLAEKAEISEENYEIVPESYAATTTPPVNSTTSYTLNITVEFGKLKSNKPYSFYGYLNIPIQKIFGQKTNLNVSKVLFQDGTTFKRTVHLKQVLLEGIIPQLTISFVPLNKDPSMREIFIKKIKLNEKIQTITLEEKKTTVSTATIDRFFGDGQDFGIDGTVTYPGNKTFGQYYEDFGSSTQVYGSAVTAHASVLLVSLSMIAVLFR